MPSAGRLWHARCITGHQRGLMMSKKPYIVIVGTDFSEHAVRALRAAHEQALQHGPAELHVVHVVFAATAVPPIPLALGLVTAPLRSIEEQRETLLQHIDSQLAGFRNGPASAPLRVFGHVLIDTPSLALTRLASQLEADLLVVGSHGLHG